MKLGFEQDGHHWVLTLPCKKAIPPTAEITDRLALLPGVDSIQQTAEEGVRITFRHEPTDDDIRGISRVVGVDLHEMMQATGGSGMNA